MDDRGANGAVGGEMTDHEEGSIRARWVESRFECANSTRGNCAFVSAGLKSQLPSYIEIFKVNFVASAH